MKVVSGRVVTSHREIEEAVRTAYLAALTLTDDENDGLIDPNLAEDVRCAIVDYRDTCFVTRRSYTTRNIRPLGG